jgi:hypothetical protein
MERLKPFTHYVVVIELPDELFFLRSWNAAKFEKIRSFNHNGHRYRVDKESIFRLHGWCPWLKDNAWNAWRKAYNFLYTWWHSTGLIVYKERLQTPIELLNGQDPISWPSKPEKWTPPLVQAVNLSKLEEKYNKHLNYGSFKFDWKIVVIVGVVAVIALLFLTGRILV